MTKHQAHQTSPLLEIASSWLGAQSTDLGAPTAYRLLTDCPEADGAAHPALVLAVPIVSRSLVLIL